MLFFKQKNPGYKFDLSVNATDQGEKQQFTVQAAEIRVVQSNKKIPSFVSMTWQGKEYMFDNKFNEIVKIKEDYKDFKNGIVRLKAKSNIDGVSNVHFQIVNTKHNNSKIGAPYSAADVFR